MNKMNQPAIEINNVSFAYEKNEYVINDVTFKVESGESVGIIGANGCGKSTLLKMLTGLLPHDGVINVAGIEVCEKNLSEIRRKIGLLFQDSDSQLFMPTVFDDVAFAPHNYGIEHKDVEELVESILAKLDILKFKNKHIYKLSGGEKRMASMAVTLVMQPEIILLDEPSTGLDPYNRRRIINVLNSLKETKIIASHDLDMILETCDRVILLDGSKIVADGKPDIILSDKILLEKSHLELPFCRQEVRVYNNIK